MILISNYTNEYIIKFIKILIALLYGIQTPETESLDGAYENSATFIWGCQFKWGEGVAWPHKEDYARE